MAAVLVITTAVTGIAVSNWQPAAAQFHLGFTTPHSVITEARARQHRRRRRTATVTAPAAAAAAGWVAAGGTHSRLWPRTKRDHRRGKPSGDPGLRDVNTFGWGCGVGPTAAASDGTHMWVACTDSLLEFNAATGAFVTEFAGPAYQFYYPSSVATDGTDVWVTGISHNGGSSVTELNAATGAVVKVLNLGARPNAT